MVKLEEQRLSDSQIELINSLELVTMSVITDYSGALVASGIERAPAALLEAAAILRPVIEIIRAAYGKEFSGSETNHMVLKIINMIGNEHECTMLLNDGKETFDDSVVLPTHWMNISPPQNE